MSTVCVRTNKHIGTVETFRHGNFSKYFSESNQESLCVINLLIADTN